MLNIKYKKEVLESYEKALETYNSSYEKMQREMGRLYERRRKSIEIIRKIEELINSIANSPKEFEIIVRKIGMEREKFHQTEEYAKKAYQDAQKAGLNIAAGVAGGAAVAAAAPTAAMWVATTFGTASTGTAISSLSGAAATNAALAWLGGGALSAGGAGMAGGQALLALAGPVGWTIAGGCIVLSVAALGKKNKSIADQAAKEEQEIRNASGQVRETTGKICHLSEETVTLYGTLKKEYDALLKYAGMNYLEIEEKIQYRLGAMVNHTLSLSELLNHTV